MKKKLTISYRFGGPVRLTHRSYFFFGCLVFATNLLCGVSALFRNIEEEHRFLELRHLEQKHVIRRSLSSDGTVNIIVTVDANCTTNLLPAALPNDFERTNGRAMTVPIEAYEFMFLHKTELCIHMIELDPIVNLSSSLVTTADGLPGTLSESTKGFLSWGVNEILGTSFPQSNGDQAPVGLCIVDTGLEVDHPNFPYSFPYDSVVTGMTFDSDAPWNVAQAESWHGTFVTGIICAQSSNGIGITGINGNCRNKVKLNIARVFGRASTKMSTVDKGVEWCISQGAKIINLAMSTTTYSYNSYVLYDAINANDEALVVAAAGNGGPYSAQSYPASYNGVLSVGAVDRNMAVASFSQLYPAVVAPGVGIFSTSTAIAISFSNRNYGEQAVPLYLSARPDYPTSGLPCDCACGLQTCQCPNTGSICVIKRCPQFGQPVTSQVANAEVSGCAGLIISVQDASSLYSFKPDMAYQSSIPVVFLQSNETTNLQASIQEEGTIVSINFAYPSYRKADGTSYSSAFVSGLATLLMHERPNCSPSQIRQAIEDSAMPLRGIAALTGKGFVQGTAALNLLLQQPKPCGISATTTTGGTEIPAEGPQTSATASYAKSQYGPNYVQGKYRTYLSRYNGNRYLRVRPR